MRARGRIVSLAPATIVPGAALSGTFTPPGDKSITHRAWMHALLAEGPTRVSGANRGADCEGTLHAVRRLGVRVSGPPDAPVLEGRALALDDPGGAIDCGNSGTALRLLAGILATQHFRSELTGDDSLRRRPVARIVAPLRAMGATVSARDGDRLPPLEIHGANLVGVNWTLSEASAQVATAVLFAALGASGRTTVEVPGPARDHTERMLGAAGIALAIEPLAGGGRRVALHGPARPRGLDIEVPGDPSAAAFFLAAAAATPGARVTARNVGLNPTRSGFLEVLERMGARVERANVRLRAGEALGDVTITGPDALAACAIDGDLVPRLVDEIPAWAVAASAARGTSRVSGAAELRHKESDRLAMLGRNLAALGLDVREHPDGLEITGGEVRGGDVVTAYDHRIAMAFAVLGTRARGAVRIDDTASIATSYPEFFATFAALGGHVETP